MPNYSYLKDDIVNTIENDSNEFATQIPFFCLLVKFLNLRSLSISF